MTQMSVENMDVNLTLQQRELLYSVFRIAHFMSLYNVCQVKRDAYTMRGWTYILLSCALFLRKSEAAALLISDIDVPTNHVTGEILLENGLPRFLYVLIRRSKTDQEGQGTLLGNHSTARNRLSVRCFTIIPCHDIRSATVIKKKYRKLQVVPCVNPDDMVGNIKVLL